MKIYNTLTRSKEEFIPQHDKEVKMYVCGITPNNAAHLGHAFTYVSFDVLVRYLTHQGHKVQYVQNATDINDSDDVIAQAKAAGKTWDELAQYWITYFHKQMDALHVLRPQHYVLASSEIKKIIEINTKLVEDGYAYEKEGNVYFDVSKADQYGKLSRFNQEQMFLISQERGNNTKDPNKKNPLDFILWVSANDDLGPVWKSPWGEGRPGWHIECSAMIHSYLGEQIDIHGGGRDLIFPHHESEIAQSESFTKKKPYVHTWMHVGMVLYEGEKMAKSLGNLVLVEDLLKKFSPEHLRYFLVSHHYRQPWEFDEQDLRDGCEQFKKLQKSMDNPDRGELSKVFALLDDDLDTPRVLRYLENECSGKVVRSTLRLLGCIDK